MLSIRGSIRHSFQWGDISRHVGPTDGDADINYAEVLA